MTESYKNILVERDESVGIVTLNRPHALNALNFELVSELAEALTEFERDDSTGSPAATPSTRSWAWRRRRHRLRSLSSPTTRCDFIHLPA